MTWEMEIVTASLKLPATNGIPTGTVIECTDFRDGTFYVNVCTGDRAQPKSFVSHGRVTDPVAIKAFAEALLAAVKHNPRARGSRAPQKKRRKASEPTAA